MTTPTLGAERVRLDFNSSSNTAVDRVERAGAALIDASATRSGDPRLGRGGRHVGCEGGHLAEGMGTVPFAIVGACLAVDRCRPDRAWNHLRPPSGCIS